MSGCSTDPVVAAVVPGMFDCQCALFEFFDSGRHGNYQPTRLQFLPD